MSAVLRVIIPVCLICCHAACLAAELQNINLPVPRMEGGKPLMQALKDRQSTREFNPKPISLQVLSDLLWAAAGINRPDSGKRTAPSAKNWQEIDVYVIMETGAYLYEPKTNLLKAISPADLRKQTGAQPFVASAPVNLVFVADTSRMERSSPEEQSLYMAADTGFISQNVYLFCASEGLGTVVRGSVDRAVLSGSLNLTPAQKIILAQTIGYPVGTK